MELLNRIAVESGETTRAVELYRGDLTKLDDAEGVDILVVSAFPDDYTPTPGSLIGALDDAGLSVEELAAERAVDLRTNHSCWLSGELPAGFGFRRILCFEPEVRGSPPDVVDDIFASLNAILLSTMPDATVAMPVVSTGDARWGIEEMLLPLLESAVEWLEIGLPLERLLIVERSAAKAERLSHAFAHFVSQHPAEIEADPLAALAADPDDLEPAAFDVFVSYSHDDTAAMEQFIAGLRQQRPELRVFVDREKLSVGHGWITGLAAALEGCRKVVVMYSPSYFASNWCLKELQTAIIRDQIGEGGLLYPVYLRSAAIETFYLTWQYRDCREADTAKVAEAAQELVAAM